MTSPTGIQDLETRLWAAANQLWAMTDLKPSEFSTPALGLLFLGYAEKEFTDAEASFAAAGLAKSDIDKSDFQSEGVLYLPQLARFSHLVNLPEGENLSKAVNDAMAAIESENEDLRDVLPRGYAKLGYVGGVGKAGDDFVFSERIAMSEDMAA